MIADSHSVKESVILCDIPRTDAYTNLRSGIETKQRRKKKKQKIIDEIVDFVIDKSKTYYFLYWVS